MSKITVDIDMEDILTQLTLRELGMLRDILAEFKHSDSFNSFRVFTQGLKYVIEDKIEQKLSIESKNNT